VIGLALLVILLDQGSKWWAESTLPVGKPVQIIGDLLRFQLIYNPGAAFSIGTGFTWRSSRSSRPWPSWPSRSSRGA